MRYSVTRRHFLRASGVSVALPFLAGLSRPVIGAEPEVRRRFVAINLGLGFLASHFTPDEGRPRLRAHEVPAAPPGFSLPVHGHLRHLASERRWRPSCRAVVSHRRAASGQPELQEQRVGRPGGRREHRAEDALCQPGADDRQPGPVLVAQRRRDPGDLAAVGRLRPHVPGRRRAREGRHEKMARARAKHPRPDARRRQERRAEARPARPGEARAVSDGRARDRSPPAQGRGMGKPAEAQDRRPAADGHREPGRRRGPHAAAVRHDPSRAGERLHADRHAESAVVRARPAGGGRHARAITTCRITARTPARSPSSR